ncbi:MAG: S1 RNA-binding domain-containing protein [Anaerolineales bacterium]|nr:S1 RNA-binding domain-containing protein [Anaerolineales bacterium]
MDSQTELTKITLKDLQPKMQLKGIVRKTELFGAFVDVGAEADGLVHISMLQRGHVNRVEDVVESGQEVEVWVRKVDPATGRLELSMIKPVLLPWKAVKSGMKVKGTVIRIESFGAFVDIGAERPGLVHVSELSDEYVRDPSELVSVDQEIDVTILDVDRKKHQIRLSMKQSEALDTEEEQDEVEEEPVATAMEIALRKALQESDADPAPMDAAPSSTPAKKSSDELEDILSRTLKHRVKS